MHAVLSQAHKVSLCADIWSKKGLTSSCLGVTAHFFSKMDHHHHHVVTLCVKRMPSAHTTQNMRVVIEEVLHKWHLSHDKMITTDSGSNMVAAFCSPLGELAATEEATPKNKKKE